MRVAIHQPNYLPWIGFFAKAAHADCLIVADNFEYTKQTVTNRNLIRTSVGSKYLTIPVGSKSYGLPIRDVPLPKDRGWMQAHWRLVRDNYAKAHFFSFYTSFFEELYNRRDFEYLGQINMEIISYLLRCFEIDVEVILGSGLEVDPKLRKTDALIALLRSVGADAYVSGPSGRSYLDVDKFPKNNIDLAFFEFQHPVYKQRYPGFEPNLAAIDLLFNMGTEAGGIVKAAGGTEEQAPS